VTLEFSLTLCFTCLDDVGDGMVVFMDDDDVVDVDNVDEFVFVVGIDDIEDEDDNV